MRRPDPSLVRYKDIASRVRNDLRAGRVNGSSSVLHWLAQNWIGVGLDLKKDRDLNYRDEFVLTFSFLERSPYSVDEIKRALWQIDREFPEINFEVRVTGRYIASTNKQMSWSPLALSIGVSFRHKNQLQYTSGTFGSVVYKGDSKQRLLLSCNHILYLNGFAASDNNQSQCHVYLPSPSNHQGVSPVVAIVKEYPPECMLDGQHENNGDYGIATVSNESLASTTLTKLINSVKLTQAMPMDATDAAGELVSKAGATSGLTGGTVSGVGQDFDLWYSQLSTSFIFRDQLRIESSGSQAFSSPGDSGSLVVTRKSGSGLALVMGYEDGGPGTFASPLLSLFTALHLKFELH